MTGEEIIDLAIPLKKAIPNAKIITAFLPFGRLENQLMVSWLVSDRYRKDLRHVIAKAISKPEIVGRFDVIILDCPPRITTGTVNALCASTHVLVPTGLDKMSAEAVALTLKTIKKLSKHLNPGLQLLGVVCNLAAEQFELRKKEKEAVVRMIEQGVEVLGIVIPIFSRWIPRRSAVANVAGEGIAYNNPKDDFRKIFDELGSEISGALWPETLEKSAPLPSPTLPGQLSAEYSIAAE